MLLYTIGHSTHGIEVFIGLLRQHGISAVADVRSAPYSRWRPHFNKERLARALEEAGIAYLFLGRELGARSEDPACYVDGRVSYRRLAATDLFRQGLARVQETSQTHRVALMCAEREPLECHRTLLVARELAERGAEVRHIHGDGRIEPHTELLQRMMDGLRPVPDLFSTPAEDLHEAYARQEARIAYVRPA